MASLAATLAIGKPVALEANAEERLTRGFISITTIRPVLGSIPNLAGELLRSASRAALVVTISGLSADKVKPAADCGQLVSNPPSNFMLPDRRAAPAEPSKVTVLRTTVSSVQRVGLVGGRVMRNGAAALAAMAGVACF